MDREAFAQRPVLGAHLGLGLGIAVRIGRQCLQRHPGRIDLPRPLSHVRHVADPQERAPNGAGLADHANDGRRMGCAGRKKSDLRRQCRRADWVGYLTEIQISLTDDN